MTDNVGQIRELVDAASSEGIVIAVDARRVVNVNRRVTAVRVVALSSCSSVRECRAIYARRFRPGDSSELEQTPGRKEALLQAREDGRSIPVERHTPATSAPACLDADAHP